VDPRPAPTSDPAIARKAPKLEASWLEVLRSQFDQPYMAELRKFLADDVKQHPVYPPGAEMFAAFEHTPFPRVRVVVLGQDPYHGPGQAHGLCFSVKRGGPRPPSLENIMKELHDDVGVAIAPHGDLTHWAAQGVLLLNTVLSVRAQQPMSHRDKGWEVFTDEVIRSLDRDREGLVFVLWGGAAGQKAKMVDGRKHLVIQSPHPSPLSAHRGFFGSRPFSRIDAWLAARGERPIDWALPA
jgi:uracil-DNA glycosylase